MALSMGTIGEIVIDVGLDTGDMQAGLNSAISQAKVAGQQISEAIGAGVAGGGGLAKAADEIAVATTTATAQVKTMSDGLRDMGMDMVKTGAAVSIISIPLGELGLKAIQTAGMFEQAQIAFTTLLGSAQKAKDYLKELVDFAIATPFEIPGLIDASKRLLAMGFSATELLPMLRTLGDAVSAVGAGDAGLKRITLAFGEMQARGTVAMKEMNQLAMLGLPAMDILAKKLDMTHRELMDAIKKRSIDSIQAIPLLLQGLNEKFGGMMAAQATTLLGMWSNVKDAMTKTLNAIGQEILPFAKGFVDGIFTVLNGVQKLAEEFRTLPEPVKVFVLAMAGMVAISGPLLIALGGIAIALSGLSASVIAATGGVVLIIPALMALWSWVSQYMPEIKAIWDEVVTDIGDFAKWGLGELKGQWDLLSQTWNTVSSVVIPVLKFGLEVLVATLLLLALPVVAVVEGFATLAKFTFDALVSQVKAIYSGFEAFVGWSGWSTLHTTWDNLKTTGIGMLSGIMDWVMRMVGPGLQPLIDAWVWVKTTLISIWSSIWSAVGTVWGGLTQSILDLWGSIKGAAQAVWGFITDQIMGFLAAAKQIPGLGKLLSADFASIASGARSAADAHAALAKSTTPLPNVLGDMRKALSDLGKEHDVTEPKVRKHTQTTKDYSDITTQAIQPTKSFADTVGYAKIAFDNYMASVTSGALANALTALSATMRGLTGDTSGWGQKLAEIPPVVDKMVTTLAQSKDTTAQFNSGMKTLGLTLVDTAETKANKLTAAFNDIATSGQATPQALAIAWDTYRDKFTQAMREMAKEADLRTDDIGTFFRKKWAGISADSTSLFTTLDKDLNNLGDIFAKNFDMRGKSMKGMMDQILYAMNATWRAVLTDIEKQFAKMIGDMIGSVVQFVEQSIKKDLIGSFTMFDSKLKDVDTHLGDMIVKLTGGSIKTSLGDAGATATKGAGGIAGASTAVTGLIPALGLVVGAIDAVFSALSYLQGRRMEQDIGRIEVTSRGILNDVGYISDNTIGILSTLQDLRQGINDTAAALLQSLPWWSTIQDKVMDIATYAHSSLMELMEIHRILGGGPGSGSGSGTTGGSVAGGLVANNSGNGSIIQNLNIFPKTGSGSDIVDELIAELERRGISLVGG